MPQEIEFIIKPNGLFRRQITEDAIDINAAIIDQFSASVSRTVKNAIPMKVVDEGNPWHASVVAMAGGVTVWSLPLTKISLNTNYQTANGMVYPAFDDARCPTLAMEWVAPPGMAIVLGVALDDSWRCQNQYLVAFDANGRQYQMPLSNLYADCRLCSGKYSQRASSAIDALSGALTQFRSGNWNSDLYSSSTRNNTRALFGFKVEEKGFSQIEVNDWAAKCNKIANEFISANIINHLK